MKCIIFNFDGFFGAGFLTCRAIAALFWICYFWDVQIRDHVLTLFLQFKGKEGMSQVHVLGFARIPQTF